jgi:threonine dehydrogenase-like Zn-dependent dehydrogenase
MGTYPAAVLERPREIVVREEKDAEPLRQGEVLLEIACAGVCGTDISIYRGDYHVPLPLVLGHEFSARIADAPAGSRLAGAAGKPVVAEINNSCVAYRSRSRCEACRRGMPTHCQRRTVTGIIQHPGAFAGFLRVPAGNVHRLPKKIPLDAAVFVESLAAAIRTFELTPIRGGETVVVLGCGRLGRLVALVANRLGARVIAVGRPGAQLDFIAPFSWKRVGLARDGENPDPRLAKRGKGFLHARNAGELEMIVYDLTRGIGADVVVEATGQSDNLVLAQKLVRTLGTVAMKSTPGVPVARFDATLAVVDEVRLQGSRCGPFDKAIRFMLEHGLPDASWITARYPLERTAEAIETAMTQPKVLIEVNP